MSESKESSPYKYLAWGTGLGFTMIVCIVIGLFLGIQIDRKLDTSPRFSFAFVILGMLAGGWVIYKGVMSELRKDSDSRESMRK